jgi:hypothetical protein
MLQETIIRNMFGCLTLANVFFLSANKLSLLES